jgi:thiol-disulfide isomerase/thioredoxin
MRRLLSGVLLVALTSLMASASGDAALRSFERGSWQSLLQAHKGHPTLIHFWGVTCGPCKVELPQLGAFMKAHPNIDVVTISADIVPNLGPATTSMLRNAGLASAENWIFNDGYGERLRFEVDPTWQGDIPRTMLVARNGDITTIEGSTEPADLEKWSSEQARAVAK